MRYGPINFWGQQDVRGFFDEGAAIVRRSEMGDRADYAMDAAGFLIVLDERLKAAAWEMCMARKEHRGTYYGGGQWRTCSKCAAFRAGALWMMRETAGERASVTQAPQERQE